jgi:hypothetical protein
MIKRKAPRNPELLHIGGVAGCRPPATAAALRHV